MRHVPEEEEHVRRKRAQGACWTLGALRQGSEGKLEPWSEFESSTCSSPINLLKSVKENYLSCEDCRHEMAVAVGALKDWFQCVHLNGESLLDCARLFKVVREALESHFGGLTEMKNDDQDQLEHIEEWVAITNSLCDETLASCFHLTNSDQGKCGSALGHLKVKAHLREISSRKRSSIEIAPRATTSLMRATTRIKVRARRKSRTKTRGKKKTLLFHSFSQNARVVSVVRKVTHWPHDIWKTSLRKKNGLSTSLSLNSYSKKLRRARVEKTHWASVSNW